MAEAPPASVRAGAPLPSSYWETETAYQRWIQSLGIPIHRGHSVADARTVELGWWQERQCNAAILQLEGQQSTQEARITEIPPGAALPGLRFALDELVYVLEGRGLTTIWGWHEHNRRSFEWQKHSMFLLPRNRVHQLANAQGNQPARLLQVNYLPLALSTVGEPGLFFDGGYDGGPDDPSATVYAEAKQVRLGDGPAGGVTWYGNFFPNMLAWDQLETMEDRGAGGHAVWVRFPNSGMACHMSVFPSRTYKKAHRHGPGYVIVVPGGEGYSMLWPEGAEKILVPWHEGSIFVPPDQWFHQHFNLGGAPARYLALHPPMGLGFSETIKDPERDQIEYPDEDPTIRQRFEAELANRGLTSLMPDGAYRDRNHRWDYA